MDELHSISEDRYRHIRKQLTNDREIRELSELFKVLCDPTRLRIILALKDQELCVHDLAALADTSESNTSHQLRILRNLRLVNSRREGKQVFYHLEDAHITNLIRDVRNHLQEEKDR